MTRHLSALLLALGTILNAQEFTVAPTGDDTHPGSAVQPLRTIQRAAGLAQAGDTVTVLTGTYRETVRPASSGREGAPIIFRSAAGAVATIDGTKPLSGWTRAADGCWEAPMAGDFFASYMNQADQLFVDGRMIGEARWPNAGAELSLPQKATVDRFISKQRIGNLTTVVFEDDDLSGDLTGARITIQPNASGWGWTLSGTVVGHVGKRLTMQSFNDCGEDGKQGQYAVGSRYHVEGLPRLIDADWEWYHDTTRGVVVLKVPAGIDPNQRQITAKAHDLGLDLTDRSWITVQGLCLHGCTLTSDRNVGGDSIAHNADGSARYPWAAAGHLATASHLVIDGVQGEYLNHFTDVSGHFFLQWTHNTGLVIAGSDNLITRCTVRNSAGNGIALQGRRVRCLGNTVSDVDYTSTDCAGISTGVQPLAEDMEIAYNRVTRTARTGITLRGLKNSDTAKLVTRVHHNDVSDFGCQDWDTGAFYMAGMDGTFVRIDHNRFFCTMPRDGMIFGMYWDYSKNYIADHNLIWGVPTPIQVTRAFGDTVDGASNLLIYNNTAIPNDAAWGRPLYADKGIGSVVRNNLFKVADFKQQDGNWGNHWPQYGEACEVGANLIYGARSGVYWTKEKCLRTGDLTVADPHLVDAKRADFRPLATSPLIAAGQPVPSVTRDGITVPAYDQEGPITSGALEAGLPAFATGPEALPAAP